MVRGRPKHNDILTPREWEVLAFLQQGLTNESIAARLHISPNTAKFHVSEILSKLGANSREEAAGWAKRQGKGRDLLSRILVALPAKAVLAGTGLVLGVAAVAGFAALLALALSQKQDDSASDLGKVAYVQDGNLWVKSLPAGPARRLTVDDSALRPKWSPSGEWLMFQRTPPADQDRFGVWVIRADGSGERKVVSQGLAAWAPEGDLLAFMVPDGPLSLGASVLVVERADGTGRRELLPAVPGGGTLDRRLHPAWSSDGAWIVFDEQHQDHQSAHGGYSYVGVRAVRIDGSGERELFSAPVPPPDTGLGVNQLPALSILSGDAPGFLTLGRPMLEPADAGGLPTHLLAFLTRSPEGSGIRMLMHRDFMAASPDGGRLAVVAGVDLQSSPSDLNARTVPVPVDGQNNKSIVVMDLQSGAVQVLTNSTTVAVSPSWSADGGSIAYVARPDTGPVSPTGPSFDAEMPRRIWTMAADGHGAHPLSADGPDCRQERPLWSADGEQILFACVGAGPVASLWLAPSSGGKATAVVPHVSPERLANTMLTGYRGHIDWDFLYDWWRP